MSDYIHKTISFEDTPLYPFDIQIYIHTRFLCFYLTFYPLISILFHKYLLISQLLSYQDIHYYIPLGYPCISIQYIPKIYPVVYPTIIYMHVSMKDIHVKYPNCYPTLSEHIHWARRWRRHHYADWIFAFKVLRRRKVNKLIISFSW